MFAASGGAATTTTLIAGIATVLAAAISAFAIRKGSQATSSSDQLTTFVDGLIRDREVARQERNDEHELRVKAEAEAAAKDKRIAALEAALVERQGK